MMTEDIEELYKKFRLNHYRSLFGRIRERDGSLSATEAYAVDVIHLLGKPTVTQLADTLGISQPNATYKVNNLVAKGYVIKGTSEDDRRECRLQLGPKFYQYFNESGRFIEDASEKLQKEFSREDLDTFTRILQALTKAMD